MMTKPTLCLLLAVALAGCSAPSPMSAGKAAGDGARAGADQCQPADVAEIAALFDRWNASLRSGDPARVVANYAEDSVLLPTLSNKVRYSAAEKADYFAHFLVNQPSGTIDERKIHSECDTAVDTGLYTFSFAKTGEAVKARYTFAYRRDGEAWLITSHHSLLMPEK